MNWIRRIPYFLVFATLAAALPASAAGFDDLEKQVVHKTLPNGIEVILLPRPNAPVISFVTWMDVGSVNEEAGGTGLAHVFEHMAFKGSPTIGTRNIKKELKAMKKEDEAYLALRAERLKGRDADPEKLAELQAAFDAASDAAFELSNAVEFDEIVERNGCPDLNAFTGPDMTVYPYSLPSNKLELWAALESDRFSNPVLRDFYRERDVVMEERRMRYESQPFGKVFEEFLAAAYKAHPYGSLNIGHMSDLENLTREQAETWFAKYYKGKNMILAAVGDIDPEAALPVIEKYFGRVPAGEKTPIVVTREPQQNGERQSIIYEQAQPMFMMGFHTPDARHPDSGVYDALDGILSSGRTSRLYKNLVKEKQIALAVGSFTGYLEKYPGLFFFYGYPNQGHANEEIVAVIWEELERLKSEPVPQDELDAYKARARAGFFGGLGDNMGIAQELAENQALHGDWRMMFQEVRDLEAVTPEDIQRVAQETFKRTNVTVAEIRNQETE
jgi:predicted Zn-dependent peptidase